MDDKLRGILNCRKIKTTNQKFDNAPARSVRREKIHSTICSYYKKKSLTLMNSKTSKRKGGTIQIKQRKGDDKDKNRRK